jgi:hypothetical protein
MVEIVEDINVRIGKVALKQVGFKKYLVNGVALINCIVPSLGFYIMGA